MTMTANVLFFKDEKKGQWISSVNGEDPTGFLKTVRIPPAWTGVQVDPNSQSCAVMGYDEAGRLQRIYYPEHITKSKKDKFERIKTLLTEWNDIGAQISADLINGEDVVLVACLIYETAMRPGSTAEVALTTGIQAYGATTLQLKHVKPCTNGIRLKFIGKKGVDQNVLVKNKLLVDIFNKRKEANPRWSYPLFPNASASLLRQYFSKLGSGEYTPKDFRTARGTKLALELLGNRKRLPKSKSGKRKMINKALDKVAKMLGNTRAVSRSAYVDPVILEKLV